jgi:hypothetical protein
VVLRCRSGASQGDSGQRVDQFRGDLGGQRDPRRGGRCNSDRLVVGQVGEGTPPRGNTLAGEHREPEWERLGARVQRGVAQLFVAGIQPGAGSSRDLAGL